MTVAIHPSCGPMPKVNSYSGYYSHGSSRPYWVGLGAGVLNVNFESIYDYQKTNYSMVSGSFHPSKDSCPLALSPSIYEKVAKTLVNESSLQLFAPTTFWEEDGMEANKTVFALLLSELHAKTSLFNDTRPTLESSDSRVPHHVPRRVRVAMAACTLGNSGSQIMPSNSFRCTSSSARGCSPSGDWCFSLRHIPLGAL